MSTSEPRDGEVHLGHFLLRVQPPARGQAGSVYVVEDMRSDERGRFERLEDALAFIQEHLSAGDENG